MPSGVTASSRHAGWNPRPKDIKSYLHFDSRRSATVIKNIANDPERVARHAFYPLIQFQEEWVKYRGAGSGKKKVRKLRYAARVDAAIFARYRVILSELYEESLDALGLSEVPIAYRQIASASGAGKNNIDFAHEVFSFVRQVGSCYVTVLDISSYFESLDHKRILQLWERLLGRELPPDHMAVYRALTQYSTVSLRALTARLKLHERVSLGNRTQRRMRNIDVIRARRQLQLISPRDFRLKVCGGDPALPSLIQRHRLDYGIPQGTPISDVVANFYLLDYDASLHQWAAARGGLYRRYSDDIILVIPRAGQVRANEAMAFAQSEIAKHGSQLNIQDKKVAIGEFLRDDLSFRYVHRSGSACRNGLEYLGFEYNGRIVSLKSATLSNAWRRLKRRSFGHAKRFVKQFRLKGDQWLMDNYPVSQFSGAIIRKVTVKQNKGFKSWTFIKYVRQSKRKFRDFEQIFSRQTSRYRRLTEKLVKLNRDRAIQHYGYRARIKKGRRP